MRQDKSSQDTMSLLCNSNKMKQPLVASSSNILESIQQRNRTNKMHRPKPSSSSSSSTSSLSTLTSFSRSSFASTPKAPPTSTLSPILSSSSTAVAAISSLISTSVGHHSISGGSGANKPRLLFALVCIAGITLTILAATCCFASPTSTVLAVGPSAMVSGSASSSSASPSQRQAQESKGIFKRSFAGLGCLGVYDKAKFARLDRVCEECYTLYREPDIHTACRHSTL